MVVNYEQLALNPQEQLDRICDGLDLSRVKNFDIEKVTDHHPLGGNFDAIRAKKVSVDRRWKKELSDETVEYIKSDDRVEVLKQRLLSQSR